MPGLLQSKQRGVASLRFVAAFFAELIGVLIFTLYGSAVPSASGPWGNGITLAVLVYLTANVSGGHLNPAVTVATVVSGHHGIFAGFLYIVAQLSGACLGICLLIGLVPGLSVGMGNDGMGCFRAATGLTRGMAFGWEFVMTFLLVAVVYAVAIGKPSFVETGPLAVGFSLWASAFVAGEFTGASLNPARTLGPTFVYHCNWRYAWVYVLAELLGGITAGLVSWPLYGTAGPWARKVLSPVWKVAGPGWNRTAEALSRSIDKLPPPLLAVLDLKMITEGEGGEIDYDNSGDEEQGRGPSNRHSGHQAHGDRPSDRGLLKGPGQHQVRARNTHQHQDGHNVHYQHHAVPQDSVPQYSAPQHSVPQYSVAQYSPQPGAPVPILDHSPIQYGGYQNESLTRRPSINMDWQTLRAPRR